MDKNFTTKSIRNSNTERKDSPMKERSFSENTEATDKDEEDKEEEIKQDKNSITIARNLSFSKKDVFYRKAKEEGFRARSVYKLQEINDNFNIIENANNILDLCVYTIFLT